VSVGRTDSGDHAEHGSGVEPLLEQEGGRPGDVVAVPDRVLHGSGTTPRGKEREVQVDPAVPRDPERCTGHERAVGHHGAAVGRQLGQASQEVRVARTLGRQDLDPALRGDGGHRGRRQGAATPGRGVGTGDDGHDVVGGVEQRPQRGQRDVGGAAKTRRTVRQPA
jgi:hypothetical protein